MKRLKFKIIASAYIVVIIGLFLYSYTQVDLNLTLSRISVWQIIQKHFQYIGWFQRPLSTALYMALVLLLFVFYLVFLWFIEKGRVSVKQFWWLLGIVSVILLFSYNAFSYDLFNYMFYGRIVTYYHENPYIRRALDFSNDPWINFMRWTHNTYPYGPVWLLVSVPISFVGMQFFLPTLFLYKALMAASFLGTTCVIGKILRVVGSKKMLFGMAFFALNPLVIIESLVSAHNDIVMIFLSVLGVYLLLKTNYVRSFFVLVLSIGIKFATAFLIPVYGLILYHQLKRRGLPYERIFTTAVILMAIAMAFLIIRTELQPWYLTLVLPFVSILNNRFFRTLSFSLTLGFLFHYVPFLYTGNWDPPIPSIRLWLSIGSVLVGILSYFLYNRAVCVLRSAPK